MRPGTGEKGTPESIGQNAWVPFEHPQLRDTER
jgi:hypothetical protein